MKYLDKIRIAVKTTLWRIRNPQYEARLDDHRFKSELRVIGFSNLAAERIVERTRYGIPNRTVRRHARTWIAQQFARGHGYDFEVRMLKRAAPRLFGPFEPSWQLANGKTSNVWLADALGITTAEIPGIGRCEGRGVR